MTSFIIETFNYYFNSISKKNGGELSSNVMKLKVSYLSYLI
jgi:hypothetical protein